VLVKGVITKKVVFEGRPAPDMERVVNTRREGVNHKMFSKMEERQSMQAMLVEQQQMEQQQGDIGK